MKRIDRPRTRPPARKLATEELDRAQGGSEEDEEESAAVVLDNGSGLMG